jgi:hypothetical protein
MADSYNATRFIANLPPGLRETGTIGAVSAEVGLASVSAEVAAQLYGTANVYVSSRWLDAEVFGTPTAGTRYASGSANYVIIGVHRYPENLRRIDLGQDVV